MESLIVRRMAVSMEKLYSSTMKKSRWYYGPGIRDENPMGQREACHHSRMRHLSRQLGSGSTPECLVRNEDLKD
jgi:hypothetical protein